MKFYTESKNKIKESKVVDATFGGFNTMFTKLKDSVSGINIQSNSIGSIKSGGVTQINSSGGKSQVSINGDVYSGNSIQINGDKVVIDGIQHTESLTGPKVEITVLTNCGDIKTDNGDIRVTGDTKNVSNRNGTIEIGGNVQGSVENRNGNIKASTIHGKCTTRNGNISGR